MNVHRPFVLEPITHKRAAPRTSLSVGAFAGENQKTNCPRRRSRQEVFGQGFDSPRVHQKSTGFDLSIFYPLRKQWYIITRHACISSPKVYIISRRLYCAFAIMIYNSCGIDDRQNFVLMICNSCGIDDIHGFRRDLCESSKSYANSVKISFL